VDRSTTPPAKVLTFAGSGRERTGAASPPVGPLVDHLFRHAAGRMVATLTRFFGPGNLQLAEDVVQEALIRAMETWPHQGVPDNPSAWLMTVARRKALDLLRRETTLRRKVENGLVSNGELEGIWPAAATTEPLADDTLHMMFLCCHPELGSEARLVLTLKTIGGFSVEEIARALLLRPTAVAQRLVRTKRLIRERHLGFDLGESEVKARLPSVLEVIYLVFNEGYAAHAGDDLVRLDLCGEAVRLGSVLVGHPASNLPLVHALLALMLFQTSRLPARAGPDGALRLLSEQDRALWDRSLVEAALYHLDQAAEGSVVTTYHLEAGIAAVHAMARTWEETDWARILSLYDDLLALAPSPVVALNRAVALAAVAGPRVALSQVEALAEQPQLATYYLLPATLGDLFLRCDDRERAAEAYRRALALPCSEPVRRFLKRRLAACGASALDFEPDHVGVSAGQAGAPAGALAPVGVVFGGLEVEVPGRGVDEKSRTGGENRDRDE
jgi:RNA polymerase sigma-70 factor (ECF subfamily)